MTLEEAVKILNKGGRNIARLCHDTGIGRHTVDRILKGLTTNPHHKTAVKIIKWVEEN